MRFRKIASRVAAALLISALIIQSGAAQQRGGLPRPALPDGPIAVQTADGPVRVTVVTKGISHPWSLAFLPDGRMLVTERSGKIRVIHDGVLDPKPITGVPTVHAVRLSGLMDIALHPNFAQ